MSRTNEARRIKWHETCKCECRLDASVCNNKQCWNVDKCRSECKELIDKGVCDRWYIWNPSNCECECDKSCDVGEYLDYENCKCRKRLVDELTEECTANIDEAKLTGVPLFEHVNECACSYTVYIILAVIALTVSIGVGAYFTYKYINRNKENVSKYDYTYQAKSYWSYKMGEVKKINIKNRTYYFYNDMINLKNFEPNLLKIDRKSYKNIGIYNIGYITIKKIDDYENIYSVNPLYLIIAHANGYIEEKGVNKYLVFDSDENKHLLKKYNDVFNGIRDKIK